MTRNLLIAAGVCASLGLAAPAFAADPADSGMATDASSSPSMNQNGVTSDDDLTKQVKSKLAGMPDLQGSNIVVSAKEGKVTLSGTVMSKDAEKAAKSAAESVPGVRKVDDDLKATSKPPSGT